MTTAEDGAGTALAIAVVAAVVAVFALLAPVAVVLEAQHRADAAADAGALAGADTALGLAPGVPCDRAREVVIAAAALLERCAQRGDVVRVRVRIPVLGLAVASDAVAGPAPEVP